MKKGFSMGEMLVTLIIVGVISALTIPVITQDKGTALKALYKAAYLNVETVVNELVNDISMYPSGEFSNGNLCANFFSKLNTIGTVDCSGSASSAGLNATTTNGMRWYNFSEDFVNCATSYSLPAGNCVKVSVDVDGAGKGINSNSGTVNKDILDIYIYTTGKMTVTTPSQEATYLTQ